MVVDWVSTSLRMPRELRDHLDKFCEDRTVGRSLVIRLALQEYLDRPKPCPCQTAERDD